MSLGRRDWLRWGALSAIAVAATEASAQDKDAKKAGAGVLSVPDYLDRVALLLDENRRAQDWVGYHPGGTGLSSMALELAELRSVLAARLGVPPTLKQAHMHMLLALENTQASFDATARGDAKKAAQRMSVARTEEQTMLLAFEAAKVKVPPIK